MPTPSVYARVATERDDLREALRDLMARLCLDTEDDCNDVARRLEIENVSSLWDAAQKAQAILDATQ